MHIHVSKIKDGEKIAVGHVYDPKELALETCDVHCLSPLRLAGTLERVESSLFFKGMLTTDLEISCSRCLQAVKQSSQEAFDLYFPITHEETIDATNEIREVMILSYPVKFLCGEDCKGLCPKCGKNLNEGECKCSPLKEEKGFKGNFDKLKDWHKTEIRKRKGGK